MSHLPTHQAEFPVDHRAPKLTRRAVLRGGIALGLTLVSGAAMPPMPVQAVMAVRVAAPKIVRADDCLAAVSVTVTFAEVTSARRYLLYGDILEADDTTLEDADFCCTLRAQHALLTPDQIHHLTLSQQTAVDNLGLVRGVGPAGDEAFSPDLVELFARIWLRDLASDEVLGPWDSPQRVAVSRRRPGWSPPRNLQGNPLLTPRGNAPLPPAPSPGQQPFVPPRPCGS